MDRLPPRRQLGDVRGQERGEKLSEYFDFATWPEKRTKSVKREELLAILTRKWLVERETRWYRRLWSWLRRARHSHPHVVGGGSEQAIEEAQQKFAKKEAP